MGRKEKEVALKMDDVVNSINRISSIHASEMYKVFTISGLRGILSSYARLYILHLLYYEPEGLTCSMIYGLYKKDVINQDVPEEMTISRSHIIDHLSDFEVEGLVKKGTFKQYKLTEKGRIIFNFAKQLALEIANNPKFFNQKSRDKTVQLLQ